MALSGADCSVCGEFFGAILFQKEGMIPFLLLIVIIVMVKKK